MGKRKKQKAATVGKAAAAEHKATRKVAKTKDSAPVTILGSASEVADQPPLIALSAATLTVGAVLRNRRIAQAGARMLASHLVATGIKTIVKGRVDRTRPARAMARGHKVKPGRGSADTGLNSFPSGHTAGAVAVAEAAAHELPATRLPARIAAGTIGAVQPAKGAHYLSDVVVGAAIGWLSDRLVGVAFAAAERALARRAEASVDRRAEEETAAHPS